MKAKSLSKSCPEDILKNIKNNGHKITIEYITKRILDRMVDPEDNWNPFNRTNEIQDLLNFIEEKSNIKLVGNELDLILSSINILEGNVQNVVLSQQIIQKEKEKSKRDILLEFQNKEWSLNDMLIFYHTHKDIITKKDLISIIKSFDISTNGGNSQDLNNPDVNRWHRFYNGRKKYAKREGQLLSSNLNEWTEEQIIRGIYFCKIYHNVPELDELLVKLNFVILNSKPTEDIDALFYFMENINNGN